MGVEPKIGVKTPKWMVKIMVPNLQNKWMILGGLPPYFWFNTPMFQGGYTKLETVWGHHGVATDLEFLIPHVFLVSKEAFTFEKPLLDSCDL